MTVAISPIEGIARLWVRLQRVWSTTEPLEAVAEVVAFQTPGIVLLRKHQGIQLKPGDIVLVNDGLEEASLALAVDKVGRDEGVLIRALQDAEYHGSVDIQRQAESLSPRTGAIIRLSRGSEQASTLIRRRNTLVGLVAPDTAVEHLYFEVTKDDGLEEGRLVEVAIGARAVHYQLINGLTKEEIVQQKNTFGYVRAQAQKIGEWDQASQRFRMVKWLPRPNAPVFLQEASDFVPGVDLVGHFPGTNYGVSLKNIDELVTHNTAILGILGVGKSMLAIELVERMLAGRIKVVCLDLTNQYASELEPYVDREGEAEMLDKLQELGKAGKTNVKKNVEEGGSCKAFSDAIVKELESFLDPNSAALLRIYNPAQFEVWRQDSKPFQETASMASLTATEIAQIIAAASLEVLQRQGMSDKARACLVFEEAHTLIPEWTAVAAEGDRTAANGTSRAILQGRKYGLGCLLITQRTANVTKTILNQCNTIFAMRTFDDTGKDFLANYIGREYADSLPSLMERQAVFYGRASSCENPVLIQLNDREDFKKVFREKYPPPEKAQLSGNGR